MHLCINKIEMVRIGKMENGADEQSCVCMCVCVTLTRIFDYLIFVCLLLINLHLFSVFGGQGITFLLWLETGAITDFINLQLNNYTCWIFSVLLDTVHTVTPVSLWNWNTPFRWHYLCDWIDRVYNLHCAWEQCVCVIYIKIMFSFHLPNQFAAHFNMSIIAMRATLQHTKLLKKKKSNCRTGVSINYIVVCVSWRHELRFVQNSPDELKVTNEQKVVTYKQWMRITLNYYLIQSHWMCIIVYRRSQAIRCDIYLFIQE